MSTQLQALLFGNGDDLEPDMRPDRIGGGRLIAMTFVVEMESKPDEPADAGCLDASRAESQTVSSLTSGQLETEESRTFLRWMANGLDTDRPRLNLQVVSADGNLQTVKGPARRLAAKAFG
jgi:hypothetical protein